MILAALAHFKLCASYFGGKDNVVIWHTVHHMNMPYDPLTFFAVQ